MTVGEKAKNMHLKYYLCANKDFVKLRILSQKQLVLIKRKMVKLIHGILVLLPTLNPIGCQKLKISHWNAKDIIQTTSALKLSEIKIGERKKINFKTGFSKRNQKLTQ